MIYCATDPGKGGALILLEEHKIIDFIVTPIIQVGSKREYNLPEMKKFMQRADELIIEKVHSMPGEGSTSSFSFGKGYGYTVGIAVGLGMPYVEITPQAWKKVMLEGLPKEKGSSALKVSQLYPDINLLATPRCRKPHDGIADAILIGRFYVDKRRNRWQ